MKKVKITKTLGPTHFEDLEPHRFEDLVGNLIYDFRDWRNIESTGRSGGDEGFDVRAWEKTGSISGAGEDEEDSEGSYPMEGNVWMIQCKREKSLGPKRVQEIVKENIKSDNIPYGYILVAPTNFSKKSYDIFREELRKRGVMEFYLWGNGDLERLLYMPKYDHILFAFFGISLITKRRSRTSEVKFAINNKNKLLRILTDGKHTQDAYKSILIRDINDENYPHERSHKEKDQHWQEHIAFGYTPKALLIHKRKYYAYIDTQKREYDFTDVVDLINREKESHLLRNDFKKNKERQELISKIEYFCDHFPRENQAKFCIEVSVPFENILVIDEKGDIEYNFPHLFTEFKYDNTPFDYVWPFLKSIDEKLTVNLDREKYKKIKIFPDKFPNIKRGKIHMKPIKINSKAEFALKRDGYKTFFDSNNEFDFLKIKDVFILEPAIEISEFEYGDKLIFEVTHKYSTTPREYKDKNPEDYYAEETINSIAGKEVESDKKILVYEIKRVYDYEMRDKFKK